MPRRHGQSQEDFILDKLGHIQLAYQRQKISGVVFQFVLRQLGTFWNKFQKAIDIKIEKNGVQAALTSQRENSRDLQMQHELSTLAFEASDKEINLPRDITQQIMQAFKISDSQRSLENTTISGKCECVRNSFQS